MVEAILFVADGPVGLEALASACQAEREAILETVNDLCAPERAGGLVIVRQGDKVQMVTAPETASAVERFLGVDQASKLSPAAIETLAIIAYRQPITRAQVEAIRGVNSDAVIRTLMAKALIQVVGRSEQAGRPDLVGTTFEFLQYLGARSLAELPPLPDPEEGPARA